MDRLQKVIIGPGLSVQEAIRVMDDSGERILFVAEDGRLRGSVTDGDIRRWILGGRSMNEPITKAMHPDPRSLRDGYSIDEARDLMLSSRKECLPVVDAEGTLLDAVWWMDLFDTDTRVEEQIDIPVVIMAGGEGARLAPYTKVLPKPLMPIGETPIIERIMERFARYGCRRFTVSVNYKADLIKAYFSDFGDVYDIDYVREDKPLGTAGSLGLLRDRLSGTFFVSNCDILVEADYADVLRFHRDNHHALTLVGSMKRFTIPYGVCNVGLNGALESIDEKPVYDLLVSTGVAVLEPEVLEHVPDGRMWHMTDLVTSALEGGRKVAVYPVSERAWLDMGQLDEFQEMLARFKGA